MIQPARMRRRFNPIFLSLSLSLSFKENTTPQKPKSSPPHNKSPNQGKKKGLEQRKMQDASICVIIVSAAAAAAAAAAHHFPHSQVHTHRKFQKFAHISTEQTPKMN